MIKGKRKKKSVLKTLKTTAENLWKEVCKLRDGFKCAYCEAGPESVLQVDHAFSRMNSKLFFDVRNGTTLCRADHFRKTHKIDGMDRIIDHLVIAREGAEWFGEAEQIYMSKTPHVWNVIELEQIVIALKEKRAELLAGRE